MCSGRDRVLHMAKEWQSGTGKVKLQFKSEDTLCYANSFYLIQKSEE